MIKVPSKEKILKHINSSDVQRAKIVAVAFLKSGRIIAVASNRSFWGLKTKWTIHAEEFLVKKLNKLKAKERFKQLFVLVARWSKDKKWSNAKPCKKCKLLLHKYEISNIYHTNDLGDITEFSRKN